MPACAIAGYRWLAQSFCATMPETAITAPTISAVNAPAVVPRFQYSPRVMTTPAPAQIAPVMEKNIRMKSICAK